MVESTMKWPLLAGTPLPTWLAPARKVLILGDAAHPMLPYMSQGAAIAIEDGAALATVLSLIEDSSSLPFALRVWEKERLQRASQMQEASKLNSIILHFPDGPEQEARDKSMEAEVEGRHFLVSANQWSDPVTQWWAYGYDAEEAMENAWKSANAERLS
jgi:salicylate hydroxylase